MQAAGWQVLRKQWLTPLKGSKTKGVTEMANGSKKLTIAVEGCCHGELDKIYATLQYLEKKEGRKVDLLISCGDFQAVRNMDDLETMACPPKYRDIQTFYKYYSGEKVAPIPTLFIGGNHEASNHLWELYYGGWAAPNIRFLGFAGCIKFGGYRIAGLSGIYKQGDYSRGHHEQLPYTDSSMRSIYHIRDFEVYRLMQIKKHVDVFLSHDWPRNIANYGDKAALLSKKTFLRQEVESGVLGSPPGEELLHTLRPSYWFSAHLHTKFPAVVLHPPRPKPPVAAPASPAAAPEGGTTTRFLALDKCLPGRDFLQVLEVDARCEGPPVFEYDEEWLAIMRTTHATLNLSHQHRALPGIRGLCKGPKQEDVNFVQGVLASRHEGASIPNDFVPTAPTHNPSAKRHGRMPTGHVRNPQTEALLNLLGLHYNLDHSQPVRGASHANLAATAPPRAPVSLAVNPEEIDLDLDEDIQPEDESIEPAGTSATGFCEGGEEGTVGGECGGEGRAPAGNSTSDDPMFQPFGL